MSGRLIKKQSVVIEIEKIASVFGRQVNDILVDEIYYIFRKQSVTELKAVVDQIFLGRTNIKAHYNLASIFLLSWWEIRNRTTIGHIIHQLNRVIVAQKKEKTIDTSVLIDDIIEYIAGDTERLVQIPPQGLHELVEQYIIDKTEKGKYGMVEYKFDSIVRLLKEVVKRAEDSYTKSRRTQDKKDEFSKLSKEYLEKLDKIFKRLNF